MDERDDVLHQNLRNDVQHSSEEKIGKLKSGVDDLDFKEWSKWPGFRVFCRFSWNSVIGTNSAIGKMAKCGLDFMLVFMQVQLK